MFKTTKSKSIDKDLNKSGNFRRTNSFSKKYISINDESEKKDSILIQSSRELNNLSKIKEEILGKKKEISPTVFYEKIKKETSDKGLKNPIIRKISGNKDFQNLSTLTNSLNNNELNKINKDDYLQIRNIEKISSENFEVIKKEIIGYENLKDIYNNIMNKECIPFNEVFYHDNVGCLLPLIALIESKYNDDPFSIEDMKNKYSLYKEYVYNYRFIKGDGNCFYRAVIFRYFEIIILNLETDLLKNIINDMKESYNSNEIRSRIRIKFNFILNPNYVLQLMIIILELLEEKKVSEAHYFYIKCINIIENFDYGLIIYFRYIFFKYIKKNENKLYLENFPIKIGNLLPSYYETNRGEFLFNKFYYCYLLSMFTDAEKIIIYLTPFVLGINLDIIVYDDHEDEIIKNINYTGENEFNFNNDKIFLLNINGHYELFYTEEDNIKYKEIFKEYINNYLGNSLIEDNKKITQKVVSTEKKEDVNLDNKNVEKNSLEEDNYGNNFIYNSSTPKKKINNDYYNNNISKTAILNNKNNIIFKNEYDIKNKNVNKELGINTINLTKENNIRDNKTPNYKFKYSNVSNNSGKNNLIKSYVKDKDKTKIINNKDSNQIYSENKKINDNIINNSNLININNNRRNLYNSLSNEENINENKSKVIDSKKIIKESTNIRNLNLSQIINNEINIEKNNNNNFNMENSLTKTQIINKKNNLSQILISPKKSEINKAQLNYNENNCHICSLKYNFNNIKETIPNICYDCLKKEIIIQLYPIYISYIENSMDSINYDIAFKNNFNTFTKNEIIICDINISIENAIKELYNKNNKKLAKNEKDESFSLFKEIKSNFCLFCLNELSELIFQIPCGCSFCSIDHIKKYFHLKNKLKDNTNYVCICSHEYSINDIYALGIFFKKNKLFSLKFDAIDILNNFLSYQCSFCHISLDSIEFQKIKYKDLEENLKKNLIIDDYTKLKHYLCSDCFQNYYKNETFFCNICNVSHIYCPR